MATEGVKRILRKEGFNIYRKGGKRVAEKARRSEFKKRRGKRKELFVRLTVNNVIR